MDQIESLLQRPKLYNNIDGVGELGMGFLLLGYALPASLRIHSPIWHKWGSFLWFMVVIAAIHYGSKAIKEHITYPRTGFVEYKKQEKVWPAAIAFVLSALVALGLALVARSHWVIGVHWGMTTPVALIGLVFVVFYVLHIAMAARWKWVMAAAMTICSIVIAMLPAGVVGAVAGNTSAVATLDERSFGAWLLSMMLYGAILMTSGSISFVLYLRHTQPPAQAAE